MKLSTRTRYGLRILEQLAEHVAAKTAVKGRDIVGEQGITEPYMEQIMIALRQDGMVKTERGRHGGYRLNKKPEEITLLNVIELFEGPLNLVECTGDPAKCERFRICKTVVAWKMLATSVRRQAAAITLANLLEYNTGSEYAI